MQELTQRKRRGASAARLAPGRRAGGALVAALLLVMTVAVLSTALLQLSSARSRRQLESADEKRAFYLAEAGLAEGMYGLRIGKSGNVGSAAEPAAYGSGLFWVEAEQLGDGLVRLTSTGLFASGRAALSLVAGREGTSLGSLGLFGDAQVVAGGQVLLDGYDSRQGSYASQAANGEALPCRVASNGDIEIGLQSGEGTLVAGDVCPGPGASLLLGEGATVQGATVPSTRRVALPTVPLPALHSSGDLGLGQRMAHTLPEGEQRYGELRVGPLSKLTIRGPATVVVDTLRVERSGILAFDTSGGPVRVYANQAVDLQQGSRVQCSGEDPTDLSLLITAKEPVDRDGDGRPDSPVLIGSSGTFHGAIYAPDTEVAIPAGFELFGSVAAQRVEFADGARVHFDQALVESESGLTAVPHQVAWRIVDLPDVPLVQDRRDPVATLAELAVTPAKPADAHEDAGYQIHIRFIDINDAHTSWSGPESMFGWGRVKTVLHLQRWL